MQIIGVEHELAKSQIGEPRFNAIYEVCKNFLAKARSHGAKSVAIEGIEKKLPSHLVVQQEALYRKLEEYCKSLGFEIIPLAKPSSIRAANRFSQRIGSEILGRMMDDRPTAILQIKRGNIIDRVNYMNSKDFARVIEKNKPDIVITHPEHAVHLRKMFPNANVTQATEHGIQNEIEKKFVEMAKYSEKIYNAHKRKLKLVNLKILRRTSAIAKKLFKRKTK